MTATALPPGSRSPSPLRGDAQAYLAMIRNKRAYGTARLALFVALMTAGFHLTEDRNAGGFLPGLSDLHLFAFDIPDLAGRSSLDNAALAQWQPWIDPARSNIAAMASDFWNNRKWHHGEVVWAMFETVLMAFLETFGAAIIALPIAFLAARNFAPLRMIRFALRRVFDFIRGVDALIWTLVLARAFGPGPMTGALAMLVTEVGNFGKLFSETPENIDMKQVEGVRSTGANALLGARFGVIPRVTSVLLGQLPYNFESNARRPP